MRTRKGRRVRGSVGQTRRNCPGPDAAHPAVQGFPVVYFGKTLHRLSLNGRTEFRLSPRAAGGGPAVKPKRR